VSSVVFYILTLGGKVRFYIKNII